MPARDIYHEQVKTALIREGWTITDDPYVLTIGRSNLFVDLGATKLVSAEKGNQKIAVEVKSFLGKSKINDLENALGQYTLYYDILRQREPERQLYLAITDDAFDDVFKEPIGELLLENKRLNLIVVDRLTGVICQWIA